MAHKALLFAALIMLSVSGIQSTKLTLKNNCSYTVWPGIHIEIESMSSSATGFELTQGETKTVDLPVGSSTEVWARTECTKGSDGKFKCLTGDCGTGLVDCNGTKFILPATLVGIDNIGPRGSIDFYEVSLHLGFNVPVSVAPSGGSGQCGSATCARDLNSGCPKELAMASSGGKIIACMSACSAFNTTEACCTGDHATPDTCRPTKYCPHFMEKCPQATAYTFDKPSNRLTCTGVDRYDVTFCPSKNE